MSREPNVMHLSPSARRRQTIIFTGLATMAIVVVLGVALLTAAPSSADQSVVNSSRAGQSFLATGTLDVVLGTAIPDANTRATVEAAVQSEIDAALSGTFIALTPTATPLPTDVPITETFVEANPFLGPADAPITIVEFSDYNCGYCGRFHATTLDPLLDHYGDLVKFVYREYPVIGGQNTADIGAAAQCLHEQDLYWEFTELVWENQASAERVAIDGTVLGDYAAQVGADTDALLTCLEAGRGFEVVLADFEAGRAFNITGTPTFFINGELLVGAQPLEAFLNVIDAQLVELGIEPPARN